MAGAAGVRAIARSSSSLRLGHAAAAGLATSGVRVVKAQPRLFWPAILVATAGNTIGGAIGWWMGWRRARQACRAQAFAGRVRWNWLERFGAKACLLSWLPVVGDPLCAVAGWLRLPFWPCVGSTMASANSRLYVVDRRVAVVVPGRLLISPRLHAATPPQIVEHLLSFFTASAGQHGRAALAGRRNRLRWWSSSALSFSARPWRASFERRSAAAARTARASGGRRARPASAAAGSRRCWRGTSRSRWSGSKSRMSVPGWLRS